MGYMKDLLITVYGGGDDAVDAAEKLAGLNRWIPVDEKPPEIGRRVLGIWMSHKGAVQSVRGSVSGWIDDDGNVTAPPTHWMPLPPVPPPVQKLDTKVRQNHRRPDER